VNQDEKIHLDIISLAPFLGKGTMVMILSVVAKSLLLHLSSIKLLFRFMMVQMKMSLVLLIYENLLLVVRTSVPN